MMRFLKWFLIVVLLLGAGGAAYYFLYPDTERRALTVVPNDAVLVIESKDPLASYQKIARAKLWKHLVAHPYFNDLDELCAGLDSAISDNALLLELFGHRYVTISVHKVSRTDFDFLAVVDLEKEAKLGGLIDQLEGILAANGQTLTSAAHHGHKLYSLKDKATGEVMYATLLDNLLAASYSRKLVEASIDQRDTSGIVANPRFQELRAWMDADEMFNIYLNGSRLDDFLAIYSDEGQEDASMLAEIDQTLDFAGFEMSLQEGQFSLVGKVFLRDSGSSFLHAMLETGKGERSADAVLSQRCGSYNSMCFDNFLKTYDRLEALYAAADPDWPEYEGNIRRLENFLKISIRDDFLGWIGDEVAVAIAQPKLPNAPPDRFLVIKTRDMELAKSRLEHLLRQIKRRTPARFIELDYQDFKIYEFKFKDLFRAVFGKWVKNLDKPYFTYFEAEETVVFANSSESLQFLIDDYKAGQTLAKSQIFNQFADNFNRSCNVFFYSDFARMHGLMQPYVDAETWADMERNADYLKAFRQIGLQMAGNGNVFDTRIIVSYNEMEAEDLSLYAAQESQSADSAEGAGEVEGEMQPIERDELGRYVVRMPRGLHEEFYNPDDENPSLKRRFYVIDDRLDGDYREFFRNRRLKLQGTFDDGRRIGTWHFYRRNGRLLRQEFYDADGNLERTMEPAQE